MIKILTVIGARPQIIKAAAISRTVREKFGYNLGVGSGKHGEQTAKMIAGIEEVLMKEHFDGVLLYGDTNSTLAGAVAASKLHVPIFHVEAGLRSHNMTMPEEVNRIVCDQLSSILFSPTETGIRNLKEEGFLKTKVHFINGKERRVINSGDVMYDNSLYYSKISKDRCDIIRRLGLTSGEYVLATIHRDNNTDDKERLTSIFRALLDIAEKNHVVIVLPLHPRTKKLLSVNLEPKTFERLQSSGKVRMIPPASFFEIIELERNARLVMTDSGGVFALDLSAKGDRQSAIVLWLLASFAGLRVGDGAEVVEVGHLIDAL